MLLRFLRQRDAGEDQDSSRQYLGPKTNVNEYSSPNGHVNGNLVDIRDYVSTNGKVSDMKTDYETLPTMSAQPSTSGGISRREAIPAMGMLGVLGWMSYKGYIQNNNSNRSRKPTTGYSKGVYHVVFPDYSPETIARKKIQAQKTIALAQNPLEKMKVVATKHKKAIDSGLKTHGADPRYLEALTFLAYDQMSDPDAEIENIAAQLGESRRVFGRNTTFDILAYRAGTESVLELVDNYLLGHSSADKARSYLTYEKVRFTSSPFSDHSDVYKMLHNAKIFEEGAMDYPWKVIAVKELFDELHRDEKAVEKLVKDLKDPAKPSGPVVEFARKYSSSPLAKSFIKNWIINLDEPEPEHSDILALPNYPNKFSFKTENVIQLPVEDIGMVMAVASLTRFESHTSPLNVSTDGGEIIIESHNCPDQMKGLEYVLDRFTDMNYIKYTREGDSFKVSRTGDDESKAYFKRIFRLSRTG